MSNNSIFLLIIIIISFGSCSTDKKIDKTQLIGNWSSYSSDIGYAEYEIDELYIGIFSHYVGNLRMRKYTLENNFLILENDQKFKLTIVSDSVVNLKTSYDSYTLKRISNSSIITFHSIDAKNDSIFNKFYKDFEIRAYQEMRTSGIIQDVPDLIKIEHHIEKR